MCVLKELEMIHWNKCTHVLEPVGCKVRVLTSDCEIIIAHRKVPSDGYNGKGYLRLSDDMLIPNVMYWSYL